MNRRSAGDEPVKDSAALQELAAGVVHGIYRAVKACQFHADVANDAVTSLTASGAAAVAAYCARAATPTVALSFLGDAVFVNRQILKASRDTHALALELGALLETCGATELTLVGSVDRASLSTFAKLLADVQRDRSLVPRLTSGEIVGITAGKAKFAAAGASREETPGARAARTYATSVLTVQAVLADVRKGKFELPRKIKRVAQQVVARAEEDTRLLVALAATGGVSLDAATIAVGSAILSVAMARQLSTDRAVLANAAMTALLYDAGRVVLGGSSEGPQRTLNDDELDRVPARTVVVLTALGRMHAPARARTTLLYEVWSMRRAHRLGQPYKGRRPPTLLARIIGVARAFAELRGAGAGGGLSIDDALQMMTNRAADGTERALVKLLIGALGIYPAGTMVTLNTGELGVVMGTPAMPLDYVRPPVKILYDEHANLLEVPVDVDLAASAPGEAVRFIWKSIDADEQQMKAMRAFVVAATAAKRRGALDAEEQHVPPSARSVVEPALPRTGPTAQRAMPEPTLQSAVELDARRVERQPNVMEAEPAVTRRPPVAKVPSPAVPSPAVPSPAVPSPATPPSSRRHPIFVNAPPPPPPSSSRGRSPSPMHEATPRSANVAPPSPNPPPVAQPPRVAPSPPPAPVAAAPAAPPRRRDPRNDSEAPSSMQDEIHRPVRVARPARAPLVAPIAAAARAPAVAPPPVAAAPSDAEIPPPSSIDRTSETARPPPSSASQGQPGSGPVDATRQMTWEGYAQALNPGKAPALEPDKATARPPPSEDAEPQSQRDHLLAAFLADAEPLGTSEPPPTGGAGKVTIKHEPD